MATTPNINLDELVDQLNAVYPPPIELCAAMNPLAGSGRWVLHRVGAGLYAVRAEYKLADGSTVQARQGNEMVGLPSGLATSLRFTLGIVGATRHEWVTL
jgi:hypothetical protein